MQRKENRVASSASDNQKAALQTNINELTVLDAEMKSLKPKARVYKQQPNSQVFFLADKTAVWSSAKQTLDGLIKAYSELEKDTSTSNAQPR